MNAELYALLYLGTMTVRRFSTRDEIRAAIADADAKGQATMPFAYHSSASGWRPMEAICRK